MSTPSGETAMNFFKRSQKNVHSVDLPVRRCLLQSDITLGSYLIENTARGPDLIEELQTRLPAVMIIPVNPRGTKAARLRQFASIIRAKRISISPIPAVEEAIGEIVMYPNSSYDDHVDTMTNFLSKAPSLKASDLTRFPDRGAVGGTALASRPAGGRPQVDGIASVRAHSILDRPSPLPTFEWASGTPAKKGRTVTPAPRQLGAHLRGYRRKKGAHYIGFAWDQCRPGITGCGRFCQNSLPLPSASVGAVVEVQKEPCGHSANNLQIGGLGLFVVASDVHALIRERLGSFCNFPCFPGRQGFSAIKVCFCAKRLFNSADNHPRCG